MSDSILNHVTGFFISSNASKEGDVSKCEIKIPFMISLIIAILVLGLKPSDDIV